MATMFPHKTLSEEHYVKIFKNLYPTVPIKSIHKTYGYDSVVLTVNKKRLFKFPQRSEVAAYYKLQQKVFPIIRENCSFKAPRIISSRGNPNIFNEYAVEFEIMPGNHFSTELKKNKYSPEQLEQFGSQIGKYIAEIHFIPTESLIQIGVPKYNQSRWQNEYDFVKKNCFTFWNDKQINWVSQIYEKFLTIWNQQTFTPVFIHGDMGFWHTFSKRDNIIGFIDWDGMRIDDPAYDLRWHKKMIADSEIIGEKAMEIYSKVFDIDMHFFDRIEFYNSRSPIAKFIKGVQFNDDQRIKDGFYLLEKAMTEK